MDRVFARGRAKIGMTDSCQIKLPITTTYISYVLLKVMESDGALKDDGLETGLDLHISTTPLKRSSPTVTPNARQRENKRLRGAVDIVDGGIAQGRLESFRHLFSFGANGETGKGGIAANLNKAGAVEGDKEPRQGQQPQQKDKENDVTQTGMNTAGFFLFGQADNTQNTAVKPDENHSVKATAHEEKRSSKVKKRKEKGKNAIDDDYDDGDDAMQVDDDNAEEEEGITTDHPLIVADVHDDAFVHMLATRFFGRDEEVERLDTQWAEMDGVRDEMRMDFKLKRQNIQRGRKLGSTAGRKDGT